MEKAKDGVKEKTLDILRKTVIKGGNKGLFVDVRHDSIDNGSQSPKLMHDASDYTSLKNLRRTNIRDNNMTIGSVSIRRSMQSFIDRDDVRSSSPKNKPRHKEMFTGVNDSFDSEYP